MRKLKNLLNDFNEKFEELWIMKKFIIWKLKISIVFLLNFEIELFEIDVIWILFVFKNLFCEIAEEKNKINRIA